MFNLKEFIMTALLNGYATGQFSRERVAIMATDYMIKGILDTADLEHIAIDTAAPEQVETETPDAPEEYVIPDEAPIEIPAEEYIENTTKPVDTER